MMYSWHTWESNLFFNDTGMDVGGLGSSSPNKLILRPIKAGSLAQWWCVCLLSGWLPIQIRPKSHLCWCMWGSGQLRCTRGGSQLMYITFASAKKQIRQNQLWLWNPEEMSSKSKTGIPVAPQKGHVSAKNLKKRPILSYLMQYRLCCVDKNLLPPPPLQKSRIRTCDALVLHDT